MGFVAGCAVGEDSKAKRVYCVDEQDRVVDENQCEEAERHGGFIGGLPFFLLVGGFGGRSFVPGQRIPAQYTSTAQRMNPSDTSARSRAGLAATGKVASG